MQKLQITSDKRPVPVFHSLFSLIFKTAIFQLNNQFSHLLAMHHRPKWSSGVSLDHAPILGWVKAPSDVMVLSEAASFSILPAVVIKL